MSNDDNLSKVIAYENGDLLNVTKVRLLLLAYWDLNAAETRAFDRLNKREDLKQKYFEEKEQQG